MSNLVDILPLVLFALILLAAFSAASHALMFKRDSRSASFWVGFIILFPVVGAILYWAIGINRINRKAKKIQIQKSCLKINNLNNDFVKQPQSLKSDSTAIYMATFGERVTGNPLVGGNSLQTLKNGDQAYPQMLQAIEQATKTVFLCSYIFDNDKTGKQFAKELKAAASRGVEVRVIVDAVGARYSFPSIFAELKNSSQKLRAYRFQRTLLPWRFHYAQLRTHRKLLVVDGQTAFIGGLNIRHRHRVEDNPVNTAVRDVHFRCCGPLAFHLQQSFIEDWWYVANENLNPYSEGLSLRSYGATVGRVVPDGPDEHFDKLRWTLLGALATAKEEVFIVTPYFVPDQSLITALGVAAMRGVQVTVVIPGSNNYQLVDWATSALLWQILEKGCRVFKTKPPFDHSKLMVVDQDWSFVGSTNWDARSLRLNFELNVELYDEKLAKELKSLIKDKIAHAKEVTLDMVDARRWWRRWRDGCARLLSPYL